MSRRTVGVVVVVAMMVLAGCTTRADTAGPHDADALGWAGFGDLAGTQVVAADGEAGIDRMERFVLRGTTTQVDTVLDAAGFDTPSRVGLRVSQPPLDVFDPDALAGIVSAEDRWQPDPDGPVVLRVYVRGETDDGTHLLHVWAFTT